MPLEMLELDKIGEVLKAKGPCVTLFLPPYSPGQPGHSAAAILKANLQEVGRKLETGGFTKEMLHPLEKLVNDPELAAGSTWGRVIFCSPDVFQQFRVMRRYYDPPVIAGSFALRTLLPELWLPKEFLVLSLTKKGVSVQKFTDGQWKTMSLPEGVPETLDEAMAFDAPDHTLVNRSYAGTSAGTLKGVRFGTGTERENKHGHLTDFFRMVDRGIHQMFPTEEMPLILEGVEEEVAMYRSVGNYKGLLGESLRNYADKLDNAYSILSHDFIRRESAAAREEKERLHYSRFATDPDVIVQAAFDGKVNHLYIDEQAVRSGAFAKDGYTCWGDEDLLNLAAIQTMRNRGKAVVLPPDAMPGEVAAFATLRF